MKKLITCALCLAVFAGAGAQKVAVDQAKKLSGKKDKLTEARSLINEAIQNPETKDNPETYFVAGVIELDAFDTAKTLKAINPEDPMANPVDMGNELLSAYNYFMQALPLDSLPNEKGQVKPKYSKDIVNKLAAHAGDYFNAGADFFNEKKYYSEAYEAFLTYGNLYENPMMVKNLASFNPELVVNAFFNAGLAAYSGNQVDASAAAFKKAREAGYEQPESYIYEIACWQSIEQADDSRSNEAQKNIMDVAKAGFDKFGISQPVFINNIINTYVMNEDFDNAFATLNPVIDQNPDNPALYGLRGFVYDRAGNDDASEADYRKAASLPDVDFETLKNVSKKLFKLGTVKLNEVEGSSPEADQARENIKQNYFIAAQQVAEQASTMNPNDSDLENVLESLEYSITTYFK